MTDFGFFRVAAASPMVRPADVAYNLEQIISLAEKAGQDGVSLLVFPELSITGYTCGDLFGQSLLLDAAQQAVVSLKKVTEDKPITLVVGVPVAHSGRLYNCAAVISQGALCGLIPKINLPSYGEFYETRRFAPGSDFLLNPAEIHYAGDYVSLSPLQLFTIGRATVAVEICEDLWTPLPPSSHHAIAGAQIIVNLSASNEVLAKNDYRKSLVANQSARTISAYVYASCGFGESTGDLVFAGSSMIYENGSLLRENDRFSISSGLIVSDIDLDKLETLRRGKTTFCDPVPSVYEPSSYLRHDLGSAAPTDFAAALHRTIDPTPFVPHGNPEKLDARAKEVMSIQVTGLATRLHHIHCKTAVIGISGGLDSTLALLVAVMAFDKLGLDRKGIVGVTMPGFGTTDRTYTNAIGLMQALGITIKEIPIADAVNLHFRDIEHDASVHDVTYENSQARERTQILMDLSNKLGGIVVGTGDLSELALGWATYNGDHMSMYGVNIGVPKTLVRYIVDWASKNYFSAARKASAILGDIVDTPISPELVPGASDGQIVQKTEDIVGPYDLHDFFLYNFFRFGYRPKKIYFLSKIAFEGKYSDEVILKWLKTFLRRFFVQQFKRSCLPDGPKVGSVALSPRGDWRMPSDSSYALWLSDLEEL